MTTTRTGNPPEEELDSLFSALSSYRRRLALYALRWGPTPATLAEVAESVTERERGVPGHEVPDERLEVYTSLYHAHVPKLVEADLATYEQADDIVSVGPELTGFEPFIRLAARVDLDEADPWYPD